MPHSWQRKRLQRWLPNAFRVLLTRVAREKALPFEPLVPSATTIKAMKEARRGDLETVTLDDLQAALDAGD